MKQYLYGIGAAVLLAAAAAQAANSPVGTQWDFSISGSRMQGLAFITFHEDGTLSGYELLSARLPKISSAVEKLAESRGLFTEVGRQSLLPVDNNGTNTTNVVSGSASALHLGFGQVVGNWGYDDRGRVIGTLVQRVNTDAEGGPVFGNAMSFTAKVNPAKSMSLVGSTALGKVTYSGIPYRDVNDFTGDWNGVRVVRKQSFLEFFNLTPASAGNPFGDDYADLSEYPGIYYSLGGYGAGYDTSGFAMFSSRKKVAITFDSTPWGQDTSPVGNASFGSWSTSGNGPRLSTTGIQDPLLGLTFKASRLFWE